MVRYLTPIPASTRARWRPRWKVSSLVMLLLLSGPLSLLLVSLNRKLNEDPSVLHVLGAAVAYSGVVFCLVVVVKNLPSSTAAVLFIVLVFGALIAAVMFSDTISSGFDKGASANQREVATTALFSLLFWPSALVGCVLGWLLSAAEEMLEQ